MIPAFRKRTIDTRSTSVMLTGCTLAALCLIIAGCGRYSAEVPAVMLESKENGYLIELPDGGDVQAGVLVAHRRWVILTIADPLYDARPLERFSSPHVDSLEVRRFFSAVQVSFRFQEDIRSATIAQDRPDGRIQVSVFTH